MLACGRSRSAPLRHFVRNASSSTAANIARVSNRSVLEVSGRDTVKLFQGLVSNNVQRLTAEPMLFAALMNPQGRMLADIFIHSVSQGDAAEGPRWLLETDSRTFAQVLSFIKKFKLRSKCKLEDASDRYSVVQAWHSDEVPEQIRGSACEWSKDPRAPGMGYRTIVDASTDLGPSQLDPVDYHIHRTSLGVGEGSLDFPYAASLPLENNIDYMNGVDFRKGCYVGQELTARTHHTGVVRKRLLPLSVYTSDSSPPTTLEVDKNVSLSLPNTLTEVRSIPLGGADTLTADSPAKERRGKAAGKFTSGVYNLGLGCLRLEQVLRWQSSSSQDAVANGLAMTVEGADGTKLQVRPWIPSWWPEQPKLEASSSE